MIRIALVVLSTTIFVWLFWLLYGHIELGSSITKIVTIIFGAAVYAVVLLIALKIADKVNPRR